MSASTREGIVPSAIALGAELSAGMSTMGRLAVSIISAIDGERPLARYIEAGRAAAAKGVTVEAVESCSREWATTTFHPVWAYLLGMDDPFEVVACVNAYNGRLDISNDPARLVLKDRLEPPRWELSSDPSKQFRLRARRVSAPNSDDPWPCQLASFANIKYAVESAERRGSMDLAAPRTISGAAALLGVEKSPIGEACAILEQEGPLDTELLSARLGCKKRTLERAAQALGLTLGKMRLAIMVVAATNRLSSNDSLTKVAADAGFADLAHMTKTFKASCGMAPRSIRGVGRRRAKDSLESRFEMPRFA